MTSTATTTSSGQTDISSLDGAETVGTAEDNRALLMADPRGDERAIALMALDETAIRSWSTKLQQLGEFGSQTSMQVKDITAAVNWTGDGANAYRSAVAKTTPAIDTLAQSYHDAATAITAYAASAGEDQSQFKTYAAQIAELTYELTGFDEQNGAWVAGKPKVPINSAQYAGKCQALLTAKQNAASVLDSFETARASVASALMTADASAPKAPPWWQRQSASLLSSVTGLKGVSKADLDRAKQLYRDQEAYDKDPSAANKKKLEEALAALGVVAAAAAAAGDKALSESLLDDEAGALQTLSDEEDHVAGTGKNVTLTQEEKDKAVDDLKDGNVSGAEKELEAMESSTLNQGAHAATTRANATARQQAGESAKDASAEAGSGLTAEQQTKVNEMVSWADSQIGKPYIWGGGHGSWANAPGYDCSGFVTHMLHAAGYLTSPTNTQGLTSQPGMEPGKGQVVTIYDRTDGADGGDHVIIDVNGHFYECGGDSAYNPSPNDGVSAIPTPPASYLNSFNTILHPAGL